jgi:ABC-type transport system involved in cytochrome bd biosynthesis fused ATPase/permease subunit
MITVGPDAFVRALVPLVLAILVAVAVAISISLFSRGGRRSGQL